MFSHFALAASQGKTRELAQSWAAGPGERRDRRLRPAALCCPSRAPRPDSQSSPWLWSGHGFVHSERTGSLGDTMRGPGVSEPEGLRFCGNSRAARPGPLRMLVQPLHQIPYSRPGLAFDLTVFGRVPGSRDQRLPITLRSELRSQEGAVLWVIMPFGGIIRTRIGLEGLDGKQAASFDDSSTWRETKYRS